MDKQELLELIRSARINHVYPAMVNRLAAYVEELPDDHEQLRLLASFDEPRKTSMKLEVTMMRDRLYYEPEQQLKDIIERGRPVEMKPLRTYPWDYVIYNPIVWAIAFPMLAVGVLVLFASIGESAPPWVQGILAFIYDLLFGCTPGTPMC